MENFIINEFYEEIKNINLDAIGILDSDLMIHTLGTDSKIIGRIFEMFTQPILVKIAQKHGYILKTPESQTVYPDFIMMKDDKPEEKIAIDIKTTYINNSNTSIKFTLGSYASYMRNNTKNIEYKYTDYVKHYVIGFVYMRNDSAQDSQVFSLTEKGKIQFPYKNVKYFIQEKYKITGDKPGSGNTENIGSISSKNFDDFVQGKGPFAELGHEAFDIYWKYYPKYRSTEKNYLSLKEFLFWIKRQNPESIKLLKPYNYEELIKKIDEYIEYYKIS